MILNFIDLFYKDSNFFDNIQESIFIFIVYIELIQILKMYYCKTKKSNKNSNIFTFHKFFLRIRLFSSLNAMFSISKTT